MKHDRSLTIPRSEIESIRQNSRVLLADSRALIEGGKEYRDRSNQIRQRIKDLQDQLKSQMRAYEG